VRQTVGISGKRCITVDTWGAPDGMPVFLLHGTPGSRSGPRPRSSVLYRLGVRLICYDRPGYGDSDPHPGRTVADAAEDVRAIADELELPSFAVVGRSGGGPHALACAALLGDRVQSAACLVGLAPSDADGLDWYDGMAHTNVEEFTSADSSPQAVRDTLVEQAELVRKDPENMLKLLDSELAAADRRVVGNAGIRQLLTETYAEAVRGGAAGWIDDVMALRSPWGFGLSQIKVPVLLWHGANDMFSPVSHTHWLAKKIPGSVMEIHSGAAHFAAVEALPSALAWVRNVLLSERQRVENPHQPVLQA
jgi:pimeloyl-ACP methyl ester carboxylesterase